MRTDATNLNLVQKAIKFTDQLNYYFNNFCDSEQSKHDCSINTLLLDYLGPFKYRAFCRNFKETNLKEAANFTVDPFFRESFVNNPVTAADILNDFWVKFCWKSTSKILDEVMYLLA